MRNRGLSAIIESDLTYRGNNIRIFTSLVGTLLLLATTTTWAFSIAPVDRFAFSVSVAPRVSTIGVPRSIIANGCLGPGAVDDSAVASSGRLVLRMTQESIGCIQTHLVLTYTPKTIGTLRVQMVLADGNTIAEAQMETVAAGARSKINLEGMWFDAATNGSGISFHQSDTSDAVFGTWFMFGKKFWYSLQGMQWIQGGTTATGIAYEAAALPTATCVVGTDCPRPAANLLAVGSVIVSVIDQNSLRVEAFDQYGRMAFVSSLKRLAF
ncbi:MAG: hypothetical protein ABI583_07820 [Betaproteobacteria bacterium]